MSGLVCSAAQQMIVFQQPPKKNLTAFLPEIESWSKQKEMKQNQQFLKKPVSCYFNNVFKKLDFLIIIGMIAAAENNRRVNGFITLEAGIDFEGTYQD